MVALKNANTGDSIVVQEDVHTEKGTHGHMNGRNQTGGKQMDGLENTTATNAEETQAAENGTGADGAAVTTPEAGTGNENQGGNGDGGDNTGTQTGTDSKETDPEAKKAFDEVLKKDKALQAEYDRRVAKALNTYKLNHGGEEKAGAGEQGKSGQTSKSDDIKPEGNGNGNQSTVQQPADINALVAAEVEKATTQIRFEACLQRTMEKAGIKDTIGYLAHIDVDDLKAHYDAKKDTIEGYETVEEEMRKSYPHYFGTGTATGGAHGTFETNNDAPMSLKSALNAKYSKK